MLKLLTDFIAWWSARAIDSLIISYHFNTFESATGTT